MKPYEYACVHRIVANHNQVRGRLAGCVAFGRAVVAVLPVSGRVKARELRHPLSKLRGSGKFHIFPALD